MGGKWEKKRQGRNGEKAAARGEEKTGKKREERKGERENEKWEVRITTAGRHIGPKWPEAAIFASLKSSAAVAASRHASNSE